MYDILFGIDCHVEKQNNFLHPKSNYLIFKGWNLGHTCRTKRFFIDSSFPIHCFRVWILYQIIWRAQMLQFIYFYISHNIINTNQIKTLIPRLEFILRDEHILSISLPSMSFVAFRKLFCVAWYISQSDKSSGSASKVQNYNWRVVYQSFRIIFPNY